MPQITNNEDLSMLLKDKGFSVYLGTENGIPYLSVYRPNTTMSIDVATRIAAELQFSVDYPVHFHQMTVQSADFFLFSPHRTYSPAQLEEFGEPVSAWVPAVLGLRSAEALPVVENPLVVGDLGIQPSRTTGFGFSWIRRVDFESTDRSGKWCVVGTAEETDLLWPKVEALVQEGKAAAACVSTPQQAKSHGGSYVICVFDDDWTNFANIRALRESLRSFGATKEIGYKRDSETMNNVYGTPDEWLLKD